MFLNNEEIAVINMFESDNRLDLIDNLIVSSDYCDDPDMVNLINGLANKLSQIDDKEYEKIDCSNSLSNFN